MSVNKSNLLYFFILFSLCISICSCSSNSVDVNEIVPYRQINAHIDLTYYNQLTNNSAMYFDFIEGRSLGYKDHGIIVFRTNGQYYAYDATCTHDVETEEHVELNDPNDDDAWNNGATCPVCGSEFILSTGAAPTSESIAIHPLKSYRTSVSGNILRVYN